MLANLTQEVEKLKGVAQEIKKLKYSNDQLKASSKEAELDILSACDDAFERAKAQALVLQPDLNFEVVDYFKVIRDGQLVDMDDSTPKTETVNDKESLKEHPKEFEKEQLADQT